MRGARTHAGRVVPAGELGGFKCPPARRSDMSLATKAVVGTVALATVFSLAIVFQTLLASAA